MSVRYIVSRKPPIAIRDRPRNQPADRCAVTMRYHDSDGELHAWSATLRLKYKILLQIFTHLDHGAALWSLVVKHKKTVAANCAARLQHRSLLSMGNITHYYVITSQVREECFIHYVLSSVIPFKTNGILVDVL